MSIKRISRRRVAAPVMEYLDEEPLATTIAEPDDVRAGGDVVTKASVPTNKASVPANKSTVPANRSTVPNDKATVPTNKATVPTNRATPDTNKSVCDDNAGTRDVATVNRWSV